jgi:hypothetical protein
MYTNGQQITSNNHFQDHVKQHIPIQIYHNARHRDIGFVEKFSYDYVKVNDTFYSRQRYTFISRPGY